MPWATSSAAKVCHGSACHGAIGPESPVDNEHHLALEGQSEAPEVATRAIHLICGFRTTCRFFGSSADSASTFRALLRLITTSKIALRAN